METMAAQFCERMIQEKGLEDAVFNITDRHNNVHIIDGTAILELIKQASENEQLTIQDTMSRIDLINGDMADYMKFLANCYIQENF